MIYAQTNIQSAGIILICNFLQTTIEVPILLSYFKNEMNIPVTNGFCKAWSLIEYSLNATIAMLMCHASIERYIFIFYRQFFQRFIWIFHYGPILFFIVYPPSLYFGLIFFYPCTSYFISSKLTCGGPCYIYEIWLSSINIVVNLFLPLCLCTFFNILLLVHVLQHKQRMRQQQIWKKNRRLVIQLLSNIGLHNIVWFPAIVCMLIVIFSPVFLPILFDIAINLFPYCNYMIIMLCPFLTLIGLPEIWPKFHKNRTAPMPCPRRTFVSVRNQQETNHK